MPYLTTGWLDNPSAGGVRQSSTLSVSISNEDISTVAIQIQGFFLNETTKAKYVEEFFTLTAGTMVLKDYFVLFNAFEFEFFVSSNAVEILVCCKDANENRTITHLAVLETSASL